MPKYQNARGWFTKNMTLRINKELEETAEAYEIKIRPLVRDELERTYRANLYDSYEPVTTSGQEVKQYNKTHKHQKAAPYHHTGLLASSVKGLIEGKTVKLVIEDKTYPDGQSTIDVWEYLKKGTRSRPRKGHTAYEYNNGQDWSPYIPTPKHYFEEKTLVDMDNFLNQLSDDIVKDAERGYPIYGRYKHKRK